MLIISTGRASIYDCYYVFGWFFFTETTDPSDIVIIEEVESETEIQKSGEMPSALGFNVRLVHGDSPVHLKLRRNDKAYEEQQVASIRQDAKGEFYLQKENIPKIQVNFLERLSADVLVHNFHFNGLLKCEERF